MRRTRSKSGPADPTPGPVGAPRPLTTFVGREREIAEICGLLGAARLVSLTGAGGSGKTRLAREVATAATADSPGGAAWVDLATILEPELIDQRVARTLGTRVPGGLGHRTAVTAALGDREFLLVLDNCEHLVEGVADLVTDLLTNCVGLRVLLTTREALAVPGEHAWHVPPLSVPEEEAATPEEVLASEAGRLFVERCRSVRADFRLDRENVPSVVRICRRLDGLPLALELAAARIRVLSPSEIDERLDDTFRLLSEGGRGVIPRHRTLRAAIDWSYELLSEDERTLLRSLSVFRGPFSLGAAEAVSREPDADPYRVLGLISSLVDRSLLEVKEERGSVRYWLLETVRQYARERARESGSDPKVVERHARFYLTRVEEASPFLTGVHRREWVERIGRDLDDLRQALAWSREHKADLHMELAGRLCWFWFSSRYWAEGSRWLSGALALSDTTDRSLRRARLLFASGVLTCLQGRPGTALPLLEEAASIAREMGDPRQEAYARAYVGMALIQDGKPEGEAPVRAAMEWFRVEGELYGLRLALLLLASLALARGQLDGAAELAEEGVAVARAFGQDRELGVALHVLGVVAFERRDLARALILLRESLECFRRDPFDLFIARSLELVASILSIQERWRPAAEILGVADGIREGLEAARFGVDRARLEPYLALARSGLGESEFERLRKEGKGLPQARGVVLALESALGEEGEAAGGPVASGSEALRNGSPSGPPAPAIAEASAEGTGRSPVLGPVEAAPALEVQALGRLVIRREGIELGPDAWRLQKPRELLVYLLSHPRGRTREQIGETFWPEAATGQSKNSFHVTLHHLRKTMGGSDRIVIDGDRYRVNPELLARFDVTEFQQALEAARKPVRNGSSRVESLEQALLLYRGDFLEDERAGPWHLEPRDRLKGLYLDGLLELAAALAGESRYDEALDAARRLVEADNLREDGHRILMGCLSRLGRVDEAIRHYGNLQAFLRAELESEPEEETRAMVDRLRSGA